MMYKMIVMLFICYSTASCTTYDDNRQEKYPSNLVPKKWQNNFVIQGKNSTNSLLSLIDIPQITSLVDAALKNNSTVQKSILSMRSARISLDKVSGGRLPSVSADLGRSRAELPSGNYSDVYSSGLSLSWEVDLWQKLAGQVSSAELEYDASSEDYRMAKASLTANVIKGYLDTVSTALQLTLEQKRTKILNNNELIIIARYRAGLSNISDLELARSNYANAMAKRLQLENTLGKYKRNLAVLIGATSEFDDDLLINQLPEIILPLPEIILPLPDIPIKSIENRPDVRGALLRVQSQEKLTQVARKALLPRFSLSASYGSSETTSSGLLFKDPLWNLLGNLIAPLYQGGQLRADVELQKYSTEKYYWSYREILLNAVVEIENAMHSEASLQAQVAFQEIALTSAKHSVLNHEEHYRQGLVDILDLLNVQQSRFDTEANLIKTKTSLLNNRVTLGLALGLGAGKRQ